MNKKKMSSHAWYKIFVYVAMIVFAISIIVPVAWVFLSSVKSKLDLVGDPWSMPTQFLWSNFVDAMEKARMGEYFINSVFVTVLGLIFLLVLALPASYVLARYPFKGKKFCPVYGRTVCQCKLYCAADLSDAVSGGSAARCGGVPE